jgi:hypothetical protein
MSPVLGSRADAGSPKHQVRWHREEEWEDIAIAMEAKALADARVEVAEARALEAERRALALEKQVSQQTHANRSNGALAHAAMAVAAESSTLPNGSERTGFGTTYANVRVLDTKGAPEEVLSPSDQFYTSAMLLGGIADGLPLEGNCDAPDDWAMLERLVIGDSEQSDQRCAQASVSSSNGIGSSQKVVPIPSDADLDIGFTFNGHNATDSIFTFNGDKAAAKKLVPAPRLSTPSKLYESRRWNPDWRCLKRGTVPKWPPCESLSRTPGLLESSKRHVRLPCSSI